MSSSFQHPHTVTVVMPCYNGMPYLPQALDSVLAQTHRPEQIIIVDDGSADDSAAVAQRYAAQHPDRGFRLVQQSNAGEPAARNAGIKLARGYWVAMFDADDWWEPDKLELQLRAADEAGPDTILVHTGTRSHFPDGRVVANDWTNSARRVGRCIRELIEPASIGHPSILVRRDALDKIGGYDPTFFHACDVDLYLRLSPHGSFAFVPKHLLHYRVHANQMSSRHRLEQIEYHHRAIRRFMSAHPDIEQQLGRDTIDAAIARHVELKLESLYWRRALTEFRALLAYAADNHLDSPAIRRWKQRSRWPDWTILLKDRLRGAPKPTTAPPPETA